MCWDVTCLTAILESCPETNVPYRVSLATGRGGGMRAGRPRYHRPRGPDRTPPLEYDPVGAGMDASATCALSAHPCAPIGRPGFRKFRTVSRLVLRESRLNRWARNTFHCRSCVVISADALTTSVTGSQIPKIRVSAIIVPIESNERLL